MKLSDAAGSLLAYKIIRMMSTPFEKWKEYDSKIIDAEGNILNSKKTTPFLRFVINLKKIISFHPLGRIKLSSLPLALSLLKENEKIEVNNDLLTELLKEKGFTRD